MTITTELQTRINAVTPATSDQDLLILCKAVEPDLQDYDITIILAETDRRLLEADSGDSSSDLLILVKCSEALGGGSGSSSEAFRVNDVKPIHSNNDHIIYSDGQEWLKSGVTLDYDPKYAGATVSQFREFGTASSELDYLPHAVPYLELRDGNTNPTDPDYLGIDYNQTNNYLSFSTLYDIVIFEADRTTLKVFKSIVNITGSTGSTSEQVTSLTSKGDKLYVTTVLSNIFRLYEVDYDLTQMTELYESPSTATIRSGYAHYSPSLDKIVINSRTYSQLWQIDLDGSNLVQLVDYSTSSDRYYGINEIGDYWLVTDPTDAYFFIKKSDYSTTFVSYSTTYYDMTWMDGEMASPLGSSPSCRLTTFHTTIDGDYPNAVLYNRVESFYGSYIHSNANVFYDNSGERRAIYPVNRSSSWGSSTSGQYPYLLVSDEQENGAMKYSAGNNSLYGSTSTLYRYPSFDTEKYQDFYWGTQEECFFHAQVDFPEITYRNVRGNQLRQQTFLKTGSALESTTDGPVELTVTDPRLGTDKLPQQWLYDSMYHVGTTSDNTNAYSVWIHRYSNLMEVYTINPVSLSVTGKVTLSGNPEKITSSSATSVAVAGGFLFIANQSEDKIWKFNLTTGVFVSEHDFPNIVKISRSDNVNQFFIQDDADRAKLNRYDTSVSSVGTSLTLSEGISGNYSFSFLPTTQQVAVVAPQLNTTQLISTSGSFTSYNPSWAAKKTTTSYRGSNAYQYYGMTEVGGKYIMVNSFGVHEVELPDSTTDVYRVIDSVVHNLEAGAICYDKNPEGGLFCVATNKVVYKISESGEISFDRNLSSSKASALSAGAAPFPVEYFFDTKDNAHRAMYFPAYLRAPEGVQAQPFAIKTPAVGGVTTIHQISLNSDDWVGVGIDKVNRRWLLCLGSSASTFAGRPYYWNFDSTSSSYLATVNIYRSRLYAFGAGHLISDDVAGCFYYTDVDLSDCQFDYPLCLRYCLNSMNSRNSLIPTEDGFIAKTHYHYSYLDEKLRPVKSGRWFGSTIAGNSSYTSMYVAYDYYLVKDGSSSTTEIRYGKTDDIGAYSNATLLDIGINTDYYGSINGNIYPLLAGSGIRAIPEISQDSGTIPWLINNDADYYNISPYGAMARDSYMYQENSLIAKDVVGILRPIDDYSYVRIK